MPLHHWKPWYLDPESARKEAISQLGRVARGSDPAEEKIINFEAMTVAELIELYIDDINKGLILGKSGRPKKLSTIATDTGRLRNHIRPLLESVAVKDLKRSLVVRAMRDIIRQIALTGCRRSEIIKLKWTECNLVGSCLRLAETKEGASVRPVGLPVIEWFEQARNNAQGPYVFPGRDCEQPFGYFQTRWTQIVKDTPLAGVTPHVLRHSFASIANDLGFTEITIASLIGHAKGSVTGRYIHALDTALVMTADNISGYIAGLLDGVTLKQNRYAMDRSTRKAALARFLSDARGDGAGRLAA